jgi:hypothetical protein
MPFVNEDPVVTSSKREAVAVLAFAAIAMTYTVVTCYRMGYGAAARDLKFVSFGLIAFPDWVFWGIVVPWLTCFVVGSIFAFFVMKDADLGEEVEDEDEIFGSSTEPAASTGAAHDA